MDDRDRIAMIDRETGGDTVIRYQLADHLGSSSIELDDKANIISYEEYHPFGTTSYQKHNTNISQKRYKYTGKERDNETGMYYYGARYYAAWTCRFVSVDPLAEKFSHQSTYVYADNNPIRFIDYMGMNAGDYYMSDGTWLYNDEIDDDKAYIVSSTGPFMGQTMVEELPVRNSELITLASVSYGESSTADNSIEMAAISNTIVNNKNERGSEATIESTIDGFALAGSDGNARVKEFNEASSKGRNGTAMQDAIGGAINAVTGGQDYSNGATHWAGDDVGSSLEKRATGGLLVTDTSHDIHSVGSATVSGAPVNIYWIHNGRKTSVRGTYSYTWETTAGYGGNKGNGAVTGTTFMKKTNNFIKATGTPRY